MNSCQHPIVVVQVTRIVSHSVSSGQNLFTMLCCKIYPFLAVAFTLHTDLYIVVNKNLYIMSNESADFCEKKRAECWHFSIFFTRFFFWNLVFLVIFCQATFWQFLIIFDSTFLLAYLKIESMIR